MDFSEYIGMTQGEGALVVERAPITQFAKALGDDNPVYRNAEAARAAGFENIPAPPTFGFSIQNWGKWEELQPDREGARNPMNEIMGSLFANGGMVLHGEQEFTYHRPIVAGDELTYRGVVRDVYQKQSGDRTLTFLVIDDVYCDAHSNPVLTSTMNLLHRS